MKNRVFLLFFCLLIVSVVPAAHSEENKKPGPGFPFNIFEGALRATTSLVTMPLELTYGAVTSGPGWEPRWSDPSRPWEMRSEYEQLNWYNDARSGYSQQHEWKEADEELYRMQYGPRR